MNPLDITLIKAIAHSPKVVMRELLAPNVDLSPDWISTPVVRQCIECVRELTERDMAVSWLTLLSRIAMSDEEREELSRAWREGKATATDWHPVISEMKTSTVIREADRAIKNYTKRVSQIPYRVREHIGDLGLELSLIASDGLGYDPHPSAHLTDMGMERRGTWGDTTFDKMFSSSWEDKGGVPSYGFVVASMPTGAGKTTLGISMAAVAVAFSPSTRITIMSNELPRKVYSSGIFRVLKYLYAGEEYDESILRAIDSQVAVYAPGVDGKQRNVGVSVDTFEKFRQIVFWDKPNFAIMDSIVDVAPPKYLASLRDRNEIYKETAAAFRNSCLEFGMLLYAPGNMSNEWETKLKATPDKVSSVMLFGSKTFENASDFSLLGWRDKSDPQKQWIKRCKNRHGTSVGEAWPMRYDLQGGYYRTLPPVEPVNV